MLEEINKEKRNEDQWTEDFKKEKKKRGVKAEKIEECCRFDGESGADD